MCIAFICLEADSAGFLFVRCRAELPSKMLRICVLGGGPAGLTAARRLQERGHKVTLLEATATYVGGRTHSVHFEAGHHVDTGAGWLTTFYHETFALFRELGIDKQLVMRARVIRGASDLLVRDGNTAPMPLTVEQVQASQLLTEDEKRRTVAYLEEVLRTVPADLRVGEQELLSDAKDAYTELSGLGEGPLRYLFEPLFEGPWFAKLHGISAAMIRLWLRAILDDKCAFFQMADGMDAPWKLVAKTLKDVRLGHTVTGVRVVEDRRVVVTGTRKTTSAGTEPFEVTTCFRCSCVLVLTRIPLLCSSRSMVA